MLDMHANCVHIAVGRLPVVMGAARMTSEAKIEANRRNALKSTGPRTERGKERAQLNALRHGMTAKQLVASDEDSGDFARFSAELRATLAPADAVEEQMVESYRGLDLAAPTRLARGGRPHQGGAALRRLWGQAEARCGAGNSGRSRTRSARALRGGDRALDRAWLRGSRAAPSAPPRGSGLGGNIKIAKRSQTCVTDQEDERFGFMK